MVLTSDKYYWSINTSAKTAWFYSLFVSSDADFGPRCIRTTPVPLLI